MRSFYFIPLVLLSLAACKSTDKTPQIADPEFALGGDSAEDSLFLYFERTPCFGECPAFKVNIYRGGYVEYEGLRFANPEGHHKGTYQTGATTNIFAEAERIGFFGMEDKYDSEVTDIPAMKIRIRAKGKDKMIYARHGIPKELKEFGKYLDTHVKAMGWKPDHSKE